MINRITEENIINIEPNHVFVFGSNLIGIHGAGAAKKALDFGAKYGVFYGISGNTFAIPTKDMYIKNTLPLEEIKRYVDGFIDYAKEYKDHIFLVTAIGCGLAGLNPEDVAPLFKECIDINNIHLPLSFWNIIC